MINSRDDFGPHVTLLDNLDCKEDHEGRTTSMKFLLAVIEKAITTYYTC